MTALAAMSERPGDLSESRDSTPDRQPISVVELLDWTYRRQRADLMSGKALPCEEAEEKARPLETLCRRVASNAATVLTSATLGARIPSTAHRQRGALHPDAELVHDLVLVMPPPLAHLLVRQARAGLIPDWGAVQELGPVERDGRPEVRVAEIVLVRYANRTTRRVEVPYCPLELYPSDAWVAMARAEYRRWHGGLVALRAGLAVAPLRKWRLAGVGAPAEPWRKKPADGKNP